MDKRDIRELKKDLADERPESWEAIPDIELYMDQVIAYMKRQHIAYSVPGAESLTPAMINNYVKSGLLPRAKGKKYSRQHIIYLTAISLLKQILSVKETGVLMKELMEDADSRAFYEHYLEIEDGAYSEVAGRLPEKASEREVAELALELAVSSYAQKYACMRLVGMLTGDGADDRDAR